MAGLGVRDPRQQAHFSLTYKDQHTSLSATKAFEATQSLASPSSTSALGTTTSLRAATKAAKEAAEVEAAKGAPRFSRQLTEFENKVQPPFLDGNGYWVQDALPVLIASSQSQNLTSTGRMDGTRGPAQAVRPVAAVHTYNDISPVLTSEYTRDGDIAEVAWDNTINRRGLTGTPSSAPPAPSTLQRLVTTNQDSLKGNTLRTVDKGDAQTRKTSVDSFWHRQADASHLNQKDVQRVGDELSAHAVAGSPNARLIGSRWRFVSRPVEGAPLYTEYYGPVGGGPERSDYYGRTYHYLPQ